MSTTNVRIATCASWPSTLTQANERFTSRSISFDCSACIVIFPLLSCLAAAIRIGVSLKLGAMLMASLILSRILDAVIDLRMLMELGSLILMVISRSLLPGGAPRQLGPALKSGMTYWKLAALWAVVGELVVVFDNTGAPWFTAPLMRMVSSRCVSTKVESF